MKLLITEKNIAARKLAEILAVGKPVNDKVYNTPVYRFRRDGEDWVSIGLKGHILGVDFPSELTYKEGGGWSAVWEEDRTTRAALPAGVATPPWPSKRKPFTPDGVNLTAWKLESLPYLVWAPIGKVPTEKELIRSLKSLARKADEIVIATDFDREGELIGSDARSIVREVNPEAPVLRARFSAITRDEIERAFSELTEVDDDLAQAGEARQDIDLVWGAVLTRFLTKVRFSGVGQPRSAGRVQTPTLRLIVEREQERDAFEPETYWVVKGAFKSGGDEFTATHATERFTDETAAKAAVEAVSGASEGTVVEVAKKRRTAAPPTPFNTTALQAAAAAEGLSPARTMRIAETLYMNGLISYPRVDNTVYPESLDLAGLLRTLEGVPAYREHAKRLLAGKLTPTRGSKEATDHPPIHPTGVADPEKLKPEEWKLYNLVARRFMATLSKPAVIEGTKVTVDVAGERFLARGDVLVEQGFRAVYPYGLKKDEQLPSLDEGQRVEFLGGTLEEKQTQPPGRYSEGGIIQEMEKRGLGTKATRHSIVQTLIDRRYVTLEDKGLKPTCLGRAVIDALAHFAERITTPEMTAELEAEMDQIARGVAERTAVVDHSRELLAGIMAELLPASEQIGEMMKDAAAEDAKVGVCPKSGHDLLVKASPKTKGQFVGCSGWPDCDVTYPLPQGKIVPVDEACATCGTPQVTVVQFRSKPRTICLDPACPTNVEPELDLGRCPVCAREGREGRIISRKSPRTLKRFARCTEYETCKVSYPLPQTGQLEATTDTCERCESPLVIVHTQKGPWRVCLDPECPSKTAKAAAKGGRGGRRTAGRGKRASGAA